MIKLATIIIYILSTKPKMSSLEIEEITNIETETKVETVVETVVEAVLKEDVKVEKAIEEIKNETIAGNEIVSESNTVDLETKNEIIAGNEIISESNTVDLETKIDKDNFAINLITQYANFTDEEINLAKETNKEKNVNEENILLFEIDATQSVCFNALKAKTSVNEQVKIMREGSPYDSWTVHIVSESDKYKIVLSKIAPAAISSSWLEPFAGFAGCNIS